MKRSKTPRLRSPARINHENESTNTLTKSCNVTPVRSNASSFELQKSPSPESVPVEKINVYLRVRPLLPSEKTINYHIENTNITIRPPDTPNSSYFCVDKSFTFKEIFDHASTQEYVFTGVADSMLRDYMNGSDVFLLCYGSTNAGKTYTIYGGDDHPGVLPRSLSKVIPQILSKVEEHPRIFASYLEIYNERIFDLLAPDQSRDSLSIGMNPNGDTEVKNATEVEVKSLEDALRILSEGHALRKRGFTELNADSSRSHTIFKLRRQTVISNSSLTIVDLAGSERLSSINSTKSSFTEACNINKSMLVLGRCIRRLKESQPRDNLKGQIPYRESKLTHIFKNLFEPVNRPAKAAIIINVSPSIVQIEDTIFSLQFAADASLCNIRQVRTPEGDPKEVVQGDVQIIKDPPRENPLVLLERQIRLEIRQEMEEKLLVRRMEFEHQLEILKKYIDFPAQQSEETSEDPNLDYMKDELSDLEKETKNVTNTGTSMVRETLSMTKELEKEESEIQSIQKSIQTLKLEIEAMQKQDEGLDLLIKRQQTQIKTKSGSNQQTNASSPNTENMFLYADPPRFTVPPVGH